MFTILLILLMAFSVPIGIAIAFFLSPNILDDLIEDLTNKDGEE